MAPEHQRKRKSEAMEDQHDEAAAAAATPTRNPARKKVKITQSQKQALIDNLQLEITERARRLRAHYALQATDLRCRIERRINRIPISLRDANMGDLIAKYKEANMAKDMPQLPTNGKALPDIPPADNSCTPSAVRRDAPSAAKQSSTVQHARTRGVKRRSSEVAVLSDKENEPTVEPEELSNPKNPKRRERNKANTATRAVSRTAKTNPSNVLSPKSHNSRTLPRSPVKDSNPATYSPSKPLYVARSASPLKPASPLKTAASAATSAISASLHGMVEHAKRGAGNAAAGLKRTASKEKATATAATAAASAKGKMAPPPRPAAVQLPERPGSQLSNHSAASNASAVSTATTVVTKKAVTGKGKSTVNATTTRKATGPTTTTTAKPSAVKGAAGGKKAKGAATSVTKKVVVAEPAAGRRVLRKRN